jgi:uncharacterized membrane protein
MIAGTGLQQQSFLSVLNLRYTDAYKSARFLRSFGTFTMGVSVCAAVFTVVAVFFTAAQNDTHLAADVILVLASGIGISLAIFIAGLLLSGTGQLLRTQVDAAVNSSPLLTLEQKLEMLRAEHE